MLKHLNQHHSQEIARKKLYKSGKLWVTATIASFFLIAPMQRANADQNTDQSQNQKTATTSQQTSTQTARTDQAAAKTTDAQSTSENQNNSQQTAATTGTNQTTQTAQSGQSTQDSQNQNKTTNSQNVLSNRVGDDNSQSSDSQSAIRTDINNLQTDIHQLVQEAQQLGLSATEQPVQEASAFDAEKIRTDLTNTKQQLQDQIAKKKAYNDQQAQYQSDLTKYNQEKEAVDARNAAAQQTYNEQVAAREQAIANAAGEHHAKQTFNLDVKGGPWIFGNYWHGTVDYDITYHWDNDKRTFIITNRAFKYNPVADTSEQAQGTGFADAFYVGSPTAQKPADWTPSTSDRGQQDLILNTISGQDVYNRIKNQVPYLGVYIAHNNKTYDTFMSPQPAADGWIHEDLSSDPYEAVQQADGKYDIAHIMTRKLDFVDYPEHDYWDLAKTLIDDPGIPVTPTEPTKEQYPAAPTAPTAPTFTAVNYQPVQFNDLTVGPNNPQTPGQPIDPNNPNGPKWPAEAGQDAVRKTIQRTVEYQDAKSQQSIAPTVTQSVIYGRTVVIDKATGRVEGYSKDGGSQVDYSPEQGDQAWQSDHPQWDAVTSPDLTQKGYGQPDRATVAAEQVAVTTADDHQVVRYNHATTPVNPDNPQTPGQPINPNNPNGPKWPAEAGQSAVQKTITRTIDYVNGQNGAQMAQPVQQQVVYGRTVIIDKATGQALGYDTNGDGQVDLSLSQGDQAWTSQNNQYGAVQSPVINGYYADQATVAAETVAANDSDKTVKVTYLPMGHLVPDVPGNNPVIYPNNPTDPTQPTNPVIPNIPGYTPTNGNGQPVKPGDQYPIDPKQPGKDTPIHYVKDLQAKVTYIDQNDGKTLHEDALTVPYQGSSDYKTANQIASLEKQGYELVSDNFPADGLHYQKQGQQSDYQVVLKHKDKTVDPNNPGQPGQPIDPNNPDGPKYPDGTDKSSLEKTITRTIDYVDGNGKQVAPSKTETVTYDRTATVDEVTGKVTYSDWTPKDGQNSYSTVKSPVVNGYYADRNQVDGKTVGVNDQDETVKVTYQPMGHLVPDVPGNNPVIYPNNPSDPTQPGNPVIPNIPAYTPTDGNGQPVKPGDQYPIDPKQPGKDTPIHYVKDLQAKVTYIDQNDGKTLHEDSLTVPYQGSSDYKTVDEIKTLTNQGYELVSDNFPADGLHYQKEGQQSEFQVVLKHKNKTVDPNNPGQPGQPIDPNNPDGPKYPDGTDKSSLEKTITRTIDYVDGNGKQVAPSKTETVTYDRTATVDEVTGKVTYSDWTPKGGQTTFAGTPSPIIPGYYADQAQVPGKTVNPTDQDETVTVTYHAMGHLVPDVPGNNPVIYPNNPTDPTQPTNPVIPNIPGYTPTDGNGQPVKPGEQYPIDPKQPGKDTPIHYVKDLQAKVTYIDQNDSKTLHEDSLTVPYQGQSSYQTADQIASLEKQGYELVSDNFPADGLHYQKEGQQSDFQVVLKHKDKTVDPNNPGQPGQPIDPNNPDGPKYPNGTDKSSLEKTITRAIDYVDGNGKQVAPSKTETVTYDRTATVDEVTGKVTYSDWTPKDGKNSYSTVQSPVVNGYYADRNQVDGKTVNPNDPDETVKVTYQPMGHLVPDVPGNNPVIYPNNPSDPTQPTNPVIPNIPGYTPTDGNGQPVKPGEQYPIDPKQPGKDTPIHYVKDLQAKVTYIDQNDGKTLHEDSLTVPYQGSSDYKTASQIASLEKQGYELVSDNFPADGLHYQKEGQQSDFQVVLKHKDKTVDPNNPGQPGQPIDPNNPDGPKYPDGTDKSSLEKTITRTIDYVDGNGKQVAPSKTETVTYDRTATVDEVTGKVTYSDWTAKDGQNSYDTVQSPVVNGYYADQAQVPGKMVNPTDQDETVTVTYHAMGHLVPDVPGNNSVIYPNNPTNPSQPDNPVIPSIPGYTPTDGNGQPVKPGDQYPIDPKQPGKDTPIHYVKDLQAKVTYIDQSDGKTLHEDSLTVPYQGQSSYKTANEITALENQGYELVSDNFPADGLHYQKEGQQSEFQVVLKHKNKTVDPNNPGQPGQPIDPNNPDGPKYPDGTDKSSLEKTITRTIDYVDGNGKQVAPSKTETVTYDRTATVDEVTGKVTYSDWTPKGGQTTFAGTPSPIIPGYYADQAQVPGKTVNPTDQDETVTVTYHAMGHLVPDVPGNNPVIYPNNPTDPTQPANPVIPNIPGYTPVDGNGHPLTPGAEYPIDPTQPGKDTTIHYVKDPSPVVPGQPGQPSAQPSQPAPKSAPTQSEAGTLPDTGKRVDKHQPQASSLLGLTLSALGLGYFSRKKKD